MPFVEKVAVAPKRMNYGQNQAAKVLAAQRMGRNAACVEYAEKLMKGLPVHPMHCAAVEGEAIRIHEEIRVDESAVRDANKHLLSVIAEYGF